jgi:neutral ceramidase
MVARSNFVLWLHRFTQHPGGQLVWIISLCSLLTTNGYAQHFRAGAAKVNSTSGNSQQLKGYGARKSTGVHDSIYHRVAVFDDGKTRFALVSSDYCSISPSFYDQVAERLQKESGIPKNNFWWSLTHTHSAPEVGPPGLSEAFMPERFTRGYDKAYTTLVENKLIEGVKEAISRLEPAKLAVGWGHSNANINRRARDANSRTTLGLNPDLPVDRRISMIRLEKPDGSPIALIANYAMHGTVIGGKCTLISGDAPGVTASYVENKIGGVMLYINGAAGNIAPIYSTQEGPDRLREFEALLGDKIVEANQAMKTSSADITLFPGDARVETPQKAGLKWPDYLNRYTRKVNGNEFVQMPIRFLRINQDIAIWSAPVELFCEISNEIREKSPYPYTFYYGYTNGSLGYLLTDEEIPLGGYEPGVSPFQPGAAGNLVRTVLDYLAK